MILAIILGLTLIMAFMQGYRYGLVNTLARVIAYALLGFVALLFAHPLGKVIAQFIDNSHVALRSNTPEIFLNQGSQFLCAGLAFIIIYVAGGFFVHTILRSLQFIKKIPIVGKLNALLGGLLNFILVYIVSFFTLQILAVVNIPWVQQQFLQAPILNTILNKTPILSEAIYQWWLNGNFKVFK